jgi:hypothetical protein
MRREAGLEPEDGTSWQKEGPFTRLAFNGGLVDLERVCDADA